MEELKDSLIENYTWWLNKWKEIGENSNFFKNYKKENSILSLYYNLTNIEEKFIQLSDCIIYQDIKRVKKIINQGETSRIELVIHENLQNIKSYNYK